MKEMEFMGSIIVTAVLKPKESLEAQLLSELKKVQEASRQENGCIQYNLHKSIEDNTFVLYEEWENNEAIVNHSQTEHYQQYRANTEDLVSSREVYKLKAID
jgi:quinol monooxygenase YgiN